MAENEEFYEGCGREGPIRAIFLSEFHHIAGPKIVAQFPRDSISKETFDSLSTYIIPKTHLQRLSMTVNALGQKIMGYPIQIKDEKYERNAYYFNVCFVCDKWAKTVQYEQVLIKFSEFFNSLEMEIEYLSKLVTADNEVPRLEKVFEDVIHGLNSYGRECSTVFRDRLLKLKVVLSSVSDPPTVASHEVPVLISEDYPLEQWDLTTQQIMPFIDGFNHITKIASLADVNTNLVKTCLQNLLYYRVIKIIPIFLYANTYYTTPEFHTKLVRGDSAFKEECVAFVSRSIHTRPNFADVVRFYAAMRRGVSIKDLCSRFRNAAAMQTSTNIYSQLPSSSKYSDLSIASSTQSRASSNPTTPIKFHATFVSKLSQHAEFQSVLSVIDERFLVLFGVTHGIIRRVEKYFLLQSSSQTSYSSNNDQGETDNCDNLIMRRQKFATVYKMFDGRHTLDEICLANDITHIELDELVERDPDILIVSK